MQNGYLGPGVRSLPSTVTLMRCEDTDMDPGIPLIGRVWDIPRSHSYKKFKQWSDAFGPIYQINVFGVNHVWIASDKIANDLLSKKSLIFSDRPPINNLDNSKEAPEYLPLLGYNGARFQRRCGRS